MSASKGPEQLPSSPPVVFKPGERSVAAGRISGIVSTGDHTTNNQSVLSPGALRPVAEAEAPPGLMNVPGRHHLFVGRCDELKELDLALQGPGGVVVAAVHGLGGVGKSTLAARYAAARSDSGRGYAANPVWWIAAESSDGVQAGLAGLALRVQPLLQSVLALEELARWALDWLGCHQDWLLILDNVNDPADIAPVMDRVSRGRVLVTSRLGEGWHRFGARVVRLEVLTEVQAVELLTRIAAADRTAIGAGRHESDAADLDGADLDGAAELVGVLGYLPLAVEQAAAFVHQNRLSPRAYLELLTASPAQMFDKAAAGGDAERTIARIWRITLGKLASVPLAGHILRVLSWYAPQDIPRTLLEALPATGTGSVTGTAPGRPMTQPSDLRGEQSPTEPRPGPPPADGIAEDTPARDTVDPVQLQQALGMLAAYNMISLERDGTIRMHRLVQSLARTPDPADPHRQPADVADARADATVLLDHARPDAPDEPAGWPRWRLLLPHIDALADHAPSGTDTATTSLLFDRTAAFLQNQGALARALPYIERALTSRQRLLGDHHPNTLASRSNLAYAYREAGQLGRAIPLLEQTLADIKRELGDDHPNTLASRNNLAYAYREAGQLERAIPLFEQTLADTERVLGTDHPDTLTSRGNLAHAYRDAGDLGRAIPLLEQTLADRQRVLGEDHRHTLISCNNLARAYLAAGDLGRAMPLLEQTLADRQRVLGEDHPDTLLSCNNLANAYQDAGELERAILLFEQNLANRQRVLGDGHPHTLTSRNNLARAYANAGDLRRALSILEQAVAESSRILGELNPVTRRLCDDLEDARRTYKRQ
ncbi:tetratricopeptide repeat protein [Actinomadura graeca]|uniref:Tetratricopeptide repeat protein n=1 Tax=Actinomadura graeca TaxID=2750812 RepID=A0ABX8R752_9ACTN|nr:FxSxx-COOH system tetratricopeptide repeat protein [Actinomadura graeca]QXJ25777.1 tetratricopeptide repeat protein [Actinomadura graeca]